MIRMVALALVLGLLAGGCATTGEETKTDTAKGNFFALCRAIDTNHDGRISREEWLAATRNKEEAGAIFDMCDVDKEGYLTYDQAYQANRDRMLEQVIRLTTPTH